MKDYIPCICVILWSIFFTILINQIGLIKATLIVGGIIGTYFFIMNIDKIFKSK